MHKRMFFIFKILCTVYSHKPFHRLCTCIICLVIYAAYKFMNACIPSDWFAIDNVQFLIIIYMDMALFHLRYR